MSPFQVALAGATGNLGGPVLEALLAAQMGVTVLSRRRGTSSKLVPHPNLTVREVDFESTASLTAALHRVDVVISCVSTLAIGHQNALIDAAVVAGVKRFIPAEFGMDSTNRLCAQLPVCAPKVATQKYLQDKADAHPTFSWTGIANGLFLDWGLKVGFILDPARHTGTLYNGGDVSFSTTLLADVATAILGVICNQEHTANCLLYVHSTATTQNKLIQYAKEKDGKEWITHDRDTEEVRRASLAALDQGDIMAAMDGFCVAASWNPDYGCDFSSHLDNELLGVKTLDEAGLRSVVESLLP